MEQIKGYGLAHGTIEVFRRGRGDYVVTEQRDGRRIESDHPTREEAIEHACHRWGLATGESIVRNEARFAEFVRGQIAMADPALLDRLRVKFDATA